MTKGNPASLFAFVRLVLQQLSSLMLRVSSRRCGLRLSHITYCMFCWCTPALGPLSLVTSTSSM